MITTKSHTDNYYSLQSVVINWLRFVFACLVVMIHVDGGLIYSRYSGVWNGGVYDSIHIMFAQGISRIAVPGFFLISGYLYFSKLSEWNTEIYLAKEKSRVKSLLMPYLIWNVIAIILYIVVKIIKARMGAGSFSFSSFWTDNGGLSMLWNCDRAVEESSVNLIGMTIHNGFPFNGPLWFIRDLFIMTLLSPIVHWFIKHAGKVFVAVISILMIFDIWFPFEGCSSVAFAFFSFGAYLRINHHNLVEFCKSIKCLSYAMAVISLICVTLLFGRHPILCGICQKSLALFGCSAFINIAADAIECKNLRISESLSKSSFFVFAAQRLYVIPFAVLMTKKVLPLDGQLISIVQYLLSSALVVAICVAIYSGMKRFMPRITSILTGGR